MSICDYVNKVFFNEYNKFDCSDNVIKFIDYEARLQYRNSMKKMTFKSDPLITSHAYNVFSRYLKMKHEKGVK